MSTLATRRQVIVGLIAAGVSSCYGGRSKTHDAEIIVIGAGLAGLNAARILAGQGRDVLVLDAASRVGGRLYTINAGTHGFSEGGGEQVGASYARVRSVAGELAIAIPDYAGPRPSTLICIGDRHFDSAEWKDSDANPWPADYKAFGPAELLGRLAYRENPLEDIYSWHRDPTIDISAYDWLVSKGLGARALEVADHTLNANELRSYSMANLFRSLSLLSHDREMGRGGSIEGGAQRLPEAMAASLPRSVILDQPISSISVSNRRVEIRSKTGDVFRAAQVVAAIPFPALANIDIDAPLSQIQADAIRRLPYTQIVQIHFSCDTPFWDIDGLPASMWTDGPLERMFAATDENGQAKGLFRAWINGSGATDIDRLNDDNLRELCARELKRLRPASAGDIDVYRIVRWTHDNPLAGGAYMHWSPGQISRWFKSMGQPAGRLFFAGEHLSEVHTGLEGAMESGERTALQLLGV